MSRKYTVTTLFILCALLLGVVMAVSGQERVEVIWFVGLGQGTNAAQIEAQEAVVERFNNSQDEILLVLNIAAEYEVSRDALTTLIASGNVPGVVGPVGNGGANDFAGLWLDLQPHVDATGYDLTQFPEAAVDFYRTEEGLVGLPFAVFPSILYYNRDLFDEAGAPYPPQEFGAPYVDVDGNEVEWSWDTLQALAMYLTVDANGVAADEPGFDPDNIVQFGFTQQWNDMRNEFSSFGAGDLYDFDSGVFTIPEHWRAYAHWSYDSMWTHHFAPNSSYANSELLQGGGGAFSSGNVAMARTHLWYTCCLGGSNVNFDLAVVPSYNGSYTSTLHADTFRVLRNTASPEAAFTVLTYLVGEASQELLLVYGALPAREEDRAGFYAGLDERYPQGVNWSVVDASLNYPDIPSHESFYPNYTKGQDRFGAFQSLLNSNPTLDVDAVVDELQADLQAIVDE